MAFQLPDGYTIYGVSNNGNTLTAVRDGHTATKPLLMIIDRTEAKYNAQSAEYSVPAYRVRIIRGQLDSEGQPMAGRLLVDANFRHPLGSESEISNIVADLNTFISQEDFGTQGVEQHLWPDEFTS